MCKIGTYSFAFTPKEYQRDDLQRKESGTNVSGAVWNSFLFSQCLIAIKYYINDRRSLVSLLRNSSTPLVSIVIVGRMTKRTEQKTGTRLLMH